MAEKYPSIAPYAYVANNPILYKDPDGRIIKIGGSISGNNAMLYNTAVKGLSKNGIFARVYSSVHLSKQFLIINTVPQNDYRKLISENGDFTASRETKSTGFGCSGPAAPGTAKNPHTIGLVTPMGQRNRGFTQSTIFEEVFHAYQHLNNSSNGNMLQIETEAKVAKVFQFYSQYGDDLNSLISNINDFSISSYEIRLLIDINSKNEATGLNSAVKNYFDALINGGSISPEMENAFRGEVLKLGERVNEKYKRHFNGKQYGNTGETPIFDNLTK